MQLEAVIAKAPVVADPLHAVDDQRVEAKLLQLDRGSETCMAAADDQDVRFLIVVAALLRPPVQPITGLEERL